MDRFRKSVVLIWLLPAAVLCVPSGTAPAAVPAGNRASIVGADVVVEGNGTLRVVELPKDGLLYGPGGDMNPSVPNEGAPSTARGALIAGKNSPVEPGPGCSAVPQVNGVKGFAVLCPYQPGATVKVNLGSGDDTLSVDGGDHGRYYGDVYTFLGVPLEVQGGMGDDRIDTQTVQQVRVDGGPGNDRISLGLSGPSNTLIGGDGDDTFSYGVYVSDYAYDLNPAPKTRRVDLDCGTGGDFVSPDKYFRHGAGCPAQPPRLTARPLTLRGKCGDEHCRWRGSRRLVVTVRNPTSHRVTLRSARLSVERWDSEPENPRSVTLARRSRISLPAHGSRKVVIPARRRGALNHQLDEYITSFGYVPSLDVTGALVERDGDRTSGHVTVRIREKPIKGIPKI